MNATLQSQWPYSRTVFPTADLVTPLLKTLPWVPITLGMKSKLLSQGCTRSSMVQAHPSSPQHILPGPSSSSVTPLQPHTACLCSYNRRNALSPRVLVLLLLLPAWVPPYLDLCPWCALLKQPQCLPPPHHLSLFQYHCSTWAPGQSALMLACFCAYFLLSLPSPGP